MNRSPEELGLAPDLSRLPIEVRDLIRHGGRDGHAGCSNAIVEVCATMFRAGYSLAEVWMVMTDPTHGIAEAFFSADGEQAESWLERIIWEADEAVAQSECDVEYRRFTAERVSDADPSAITN